MANHPDLAKKLKHLYNLRVNPKISSHTELAAEFGITKQAVSKWIHGSETRRGNSIPGAVVEDLSNLFRLKQHWFALPYEEFAELVVTMLETQDEPTAQRPVKISISQLPTTSPLVFGREHELEILNDAWSKKVANVVQIVGFGGVGKSCLVNYWLADLNTRNYLDAKQVYAWSFYWQGAASDVKSSGDFFIEHALTWFGDNDPSKGTPWSKANRLARLMRESRTILILDGFEPLQSPPGTDSGNIENPAVSFLIKELASDNNGLCIITTRLPVIELSSSHDERIKSIYLDNPSVSASVGILKSMGINGSGKDLKKAVNKYACHPLSLILLGGYLNVVYQGNVQKTVMLNSLFEEESQSFQAKNLMRGYLSWFQGRPEQTLLNLISLLDRTTSIEEIRTISDLDSDSEIAAVLQKLTYVQLSYAIKRLCDARLIDIQQVAGKRVIDCHPLVKDYAVLKLKEEDTNNWIEGNKLLFRYYQYNMSEHPEKIIELDNLFRAVIHGTRAMLFKEAFHLYFFQLKSGYTMLSRGSHYADQFCISAFFTRAWTTPTDKLSEEQQIHLYSSLAANQMSLGNIKDAIMYYEKSISWFFRERKWFEASAFSGPYISMLIAVGRLHDVGKVMGDLDPYVGNCNNSVLIAMGQVFHAYVGYLKGDRDFAAINFELADSVITKPEPGVVVSFPTVSSYYCKFLLETDKLQEALERLLKTFGWRSRKTWQVAIDTPSILASDLLVLGLTFLARGDLINAKKYLDEQVELFRSSDEWLYLPTGLHSRARYFIKIKEYDSAIRDLEEALQISRDTGAIFGEWESYLNFAQLHRTREEPEQCEDYLRKAQGFPCMLAYKFRNKEIAELEIYIKQQKDHKQSSDD